MKKNLIKYIFLILSIFGLLLIYLSTVGIQTEKFNNQIKNKVFQKNNDLEIDLKKIKLIFDPLKFKIEAKTVDANLFFKGENLQLKYINSQISLISLIKNNFAISKLEILSEFISLKSLISLIRITTNKPELFFLESFIKKGQISVNINLDFDKNGKIKDDYRIKGKLKDAKIELFKDYNFKNLNFSLNANNDIFDLNNLSFTANNIDFFSKNLKINRNENFFLVEGDIENKNSIFNNEFLKLLNFDKIKISNTNFNSKNKFSFNIDKKLKVKNLLITSEIQVNKSEYLKPTSFSNFLTNEDDFIYIKDHKIISKYENNKFIAEGAGKIKLEKKFDKINYKIDLKDKKFNFISNLLLSELTLKNHTALKPFFPELDESINMENHQIEINYKNNALKIKGFGKIKLTNTLEDIGYNFSKIKNKINFDTKLNLKKTILNVSFLNFKKNKKSNEQLNISGNYTKDKELNFKKISIIGKNDKILLENLLLDNNNQIIKVDKMDLDFLDQEDKRNKILVLKKNRNEYQINGSLFNANTLISNLLEVSDDKKSNTFNNDFKLKINLDKVYIDDQNIIKDLKGQLEINNNLVSKASLSAFFKDNKNINFSVSTNENKKVTTLYSSKAKPFVKRYNFIKGFEEGDLNFSSVKKNGVSNSLLIIDNFKVQEIPVLAKLLSLASLQGIADLLTGEGIRFTDFEMKFSNDKNLMTIDELYAIGPSISILMDGYIQSNELISLRGTLVPASTINKTIASIPLIGDFLVGKKIGEGVFGVSFKIKGPPKGLKTTVNPVKTLTPRFITRTLEKIKKN